MTAPTTELDYLRRLLDLLEKAWEARRHIDIDFAVFEDSEDVPYTVHCEDALLHCIEQTRDDVAGLERARMHLGN